MMTAGPWRLDALEILARDRRPAKFDERPPRRAGGGSMVDDEAVDAGLRAKLRMLARLPSTSSTR